MKTQTQEQGGGGVSRQSTRLSIRDTPLDTSTRLRKRSSMNVSYKDAEETMEPVDLGPTLEERRQEIIDRYYGEVKQRALALLAARQAGLKRTGDAETEQTAPPSTAMDGERLPTIEEKRDDDQLSKQGTTTQMDSETKASDVAADIQEAEEMAAAQERMAENGNKDEDVEAMENDAVDGIVEEPSDDSQEPPELSQELIQALHEAVWEGDVDLLDDMLDLPGANIDLLWFGENLLMTAIRAGQAEAASYLIENGVNVHHEVTRFDKKDDLQLEIDAKRAAYEQEQEELKAKKKKTKKKDKEKEMLEQLEKEKEEDEVKTPDAKPANALTDFDCYLVNCRMMAVECEREDITEYIDEVNGALWPEELVPRKSRHKRKKQDLMEKIKQREDWVLSEEEIIEPEEEPELKAKERLRKKKLLSRQSTTEPDRASKLTQRTRRTTVQSEKDVTLNLSSDKQAGVFTDGPTLAGEDTTLFLTPSPDNTPVPAIHHSVQMRSPETKVPYRGTRAFLIRQSANLKYKELNLDVPKSMPKRESVKSRSKSSQKESLKPKEITANSAGRNDFYNDIQRFQRLRSRNTRKVSPWEDDNPDTLLNMFKRSNTQPHLSRAEADINKARLSKENTFTLGEQKFGPTLSNLPLRSVSSFAFGDKGLQSKSFAFGDKGVESKRSENSKKIQDRKTGRSASSHVLRRYKSEIIKNDKPPQTSPVKSSQRNPLTQSMKNIQSSGSYNNLSNVRENAWLEKGSPVNMVQKYYKAKRYSPAGYLKGGRSQDDMEHYNHLSLYEKRREKSMAVTGALTVT